MKDAVQVKTGIPIPPRQSAQTTKWTRAISRLQPGESFVAPNTVRLWPLYRAAKRNGYKITTRELETGAVGVWRVE